MKYFTESEFMQGLIPVFEKMDIKLLNNIDSLRELCGFPLKINSSYRNEQYNRLKGGHKYSLHLQGKAVDLHCIDALMRKEIVKHALNLGFSVGVAKTFIHIDTRDVQLLFTY